MKNKISKVADWTLRIGILAVSAAPMVSFAQLGGNQFGAPGPQAPTGGNAVQFTTISGALCTLVAWIFTLLIILTVVFILWAAYLYLTSAGDEEKIKKANHQLLYAAIAVIVAVLSRGLPFLVNQFVGGNSLVSC